jgi:undecaprenyl-diphosphatase
MKSRIILISLILFIVIAIGVINDNLIGFDNSVHSAVISIKNIFFDYFFSFFTHIFDNIGFVLLSILLIGYLYLRNRKKDSLIALIVLAGGAILGQILKLLFAIQRPEGIVDFLGYSFPSGHAIKVTLFMLLLIYLFKDKIINKNKNKIFVALSWAVILIVCLSRIYLGAHWASDVIGGFFFAFGWINLILYSSLKLIKK